MFDLRLIPKEINLRKLAIPYFSFKELYKNAEACLFFNFPSVNGAAKVRLLFSNYQAPRKKKITFFFICKTLFQNGGAKVRLYFQKATNIFIIF